LEGVRGCACCWGRRSGRGATAEWDPAGHVRIPARRGERAAAWNCPRAQPRGESTWRKSCRRWIAVGLTAGCWNSPTPRTAGQRHSDESALPRALGPGSVSLEREAYANQQRLRIWPSPCGRANCPQKAADGSQLENGTQRTGSSLRSKHPSSSMLNCSSCFVAELPGGAKAKVLLQELPGPGWLPTQLAEQLTPTGPSSSAAARGGGTRAGIAASAAWRRRLRIGEQVGIADQAAAAWMARRPRARWSPPARGPAQPLSCRLQPPSTRPRSILG